MRAVLLKSTQVLFHFTDAYRVSGYKEEEKVPAFRESGLQAKTDVQTDNYNPVLCSEHCVWGPRCGTRSGTSARSPCGGVWLWQRKGGYLVKEFTCSSTYHSVYHVGGAGKKDLLNEWN